MPDNIVCKYCSAEIPEEVFEEHKDKRRRTIFKGKCPSCGKINIKYPKRIPEPEPEIPDDLPPPNFPPVEPEPEITPAEEVPEDQEEVLEPEAVEVLDPGEKTEEELEEEKEPEDWEKAKRNYQIGVMVLVGIILALVGISIWLWTRIDKLEKTEKEVEDYGSQEASMDRDR